VAFWNEDSEEIAIVALDAQKRERFAEVEPLYQLSLTIQGAEARAEKF
jgi:hypothetical protein